MSSKRKNGYRTSRAALKLVATRYSARTNGAGMLGTREGRQVETLARLMVRQAPAKARANYFVQSWASALVCS